MLESYGNDFDEEVLKIQLKAFAVILKMKVKASKYL